MAKRPQMDKMTQKGQNVTRGQNVTEWTTCERRGKMLPEDKMSQCRRTCHMVDNMSHIDELSHAEQTPSPHASDHHMLTPPKPPIPNDVP